MAPAHPGRQLRSLVSKLNGLAAVCARTRASPGLSDTEPGTVNQSASEKGPANWLPGMSTVTLVMVTAWLKDGAPINKAPETRATRRTRVFLISRSFSCATCGYLLRA